MSGYWTEINKTRTSHATIADCGVFSRVITVDDIHDGVWVDDGVECGCIECGGLRGINYKWLLSGFMRSESLPEKMHAEDCLYNDVR